ncbi:aspartate-alanine antiporter [Variovorax dokdonensis]|uniref:Aspartate-alanine antiporter n=2 Tax=Variovorax dokdonensis TaxID=344883 RepID=A0ABT7NG74_9BURK|nr:aspartate-alanine antiporter [Variovorax dokdonensis]MDM0046835.1 aspartate-alanine antiporter [Variovorax dokdonensis]
MDWLVQTLRQYPELGLFAALAFGFWLGPKKFFGFNLGAVTATLIAGVAIGQLGLSIPGPIKSTFFLLFLFAVGYGVGPQFFAGLGKDGPKQIAFTLIVMVACLVVPVVCALIAGLDVGYAVGLYAGSQTISASIGVATDQINKSGLDANAAKTMLASIPVGYAVTYIFGTVGSAIILSKLAPKLLGIDLVKACKDYETRLGGGKKTLQTGILSAYHRFGVRGYRITEHSGLAGKRCQDTYPGVRVFFERIKRDGQIIVAQPDTVLQVGDLVAISGARKLLVENVESILEEIEDPELLDVSATVVDVFVTSKAINGKTIAELAQLPEARGVYLAKITRQLVDIPLLPGTEILRGDVIRIGGSVDHVNAVVKVLGYADRPTDVSDISFIAAGILVGGLLGVLSVTVGGVPISLSTSGGALLAGLFLGYYRTIKPKFGQIPAPALWVLNNLGLNVFIAIVGINAGPDFIGGLQKLGLSLFLWGVVATSVPLLIAMYVGRYIFKFDPAILLGCCAGARTTTAALGMVQDAAKSNIPALGYGMPYAVGNTFLTIWGLVIVIVMMKFGGAGG